MIVDIQEKNKNQAPTSSVPAAVEALTSPLSPPPPAYAHLAPASSLTVHVPPIPGSSLPASVATNSPPLHYGDYPRPPLSQPTLGLVQDLSPASAGTPTSIVVNTHPQAQGTQPGTYEMTVRTMTIPPPMPLDLPDTDLVKIGRDYQAFMMAKCARGDHDYSTSYGMAGILTCIFCFPIGIIGLFVDSEQRCVRCGVDAKNAGQQ